MSISVSGLVKFYGQQKVLKEISFTVEQGGVLGFLGPNGAGKSTLMKILSGSITPSSGKAYVNGLDVVERSMDVRRQIGYLPEHNPLYLDMYVREYLQMVAAIYKVPLTANAVNGAIERTGLGSECHKKIEQLSKGYRQRVGLAQTLLHDPEVLILDEPTTGLDPNQIVEIRNLIREVGREKTVILSSHIMQEVEAICERVIIINKGDIVADGATSALKMQAAGGDTVEVEFLEETTATLFEYAAFINHAERAASGVFSIQAADPQEDIRAKLFRWAVDNKLTIINMQRKERHLEDVFRQLTQLNENEG